MNYDEFKKIALFDFDSEFLIEEDVEDRRPFMESTQIEEVIRKHFSENASREGAFAAGKEIKGLWPAWLRDGRKF